MKNDLLRNFASCSRLVSQKSKSSNNDEKNIIIDQDSITLQPEFCSLLCHQIAQEMKQISSEKITIAGIATQGMSLGVRVAEILNYRFIYMRGSAKKHGLKNQIEGELNPDQKVLLFALKIPPPKSLENAIAVFQQHRLHLNHIFSIVGPDSCSTSDEYFIKNGIELHFLIPYHKLVKHL